MPTLMLCRVVLQFIFNKYGIIMEMKAYFMHEQNGEKKKKGKHQRINSK